MTFSLLRRSYGSFSMAVEKKQNHIFTIIFHMLCACIFYYFLGQLMVKLMFVDDRRQF